MMQKKTKLTIFTPTYNREHTITRTYESILRQNAKFFGEIEWLIVDDGSTDQTSHIVEEWITRQPPFAIRYIRQNNGGKHTAFNRAVVEATGELFFTVDSDDWLSDDGVEAILKLYDTIIRNSQLAGMVALKNFPSGELIGIPFPKDNAITSLYELAMYGYGGERSLVYKTNVLKQYPFPVIPGERFMGECVVYDRIDMHYRLLTHNKCLTVCEYQPDGLTNNLFKLMMQNAVGYKIYYSQRIDMAHSLRERIGYAIRYHSFCMIKKDSQYNYKGKHSILVGLTYPLGFLGYFYYKFKDR